MGFNYIVYEIEHVLFCQLNSLTLNYGALRPVLCLVLYNLIELNLRWYNTDVVVGGGDDNENSPADDDDNDDDDYDNGPVLMMVIMMMMMLNFDNEMVELHINCTHLYICTCYYISDYCFVCKSAKYKSTVFVLSFQSRHPQKIDLGELSLTF